MRKVAIIFVLAVLVPSLVLAWLAVRSLRDQEFALHRHRALLYEGVADSTVKDVLAHLEARRGEFNRLLDKLSHGATPHHAAEHFDARLREIWPLAQAGFVVTLDGRVLAPSLFAGPAARKFRRDNERFFTSHETVEVHWINPKGTMSRSRLEAKEMTEEAKGPSRAEFREVIGNETDGSIARFLEDKLNLFFWQRAESDAVFGTQVDMDRLVAELRPLVRVEAGLASEIVVALLDDQSRAISTSRVNFSTGGKRPIVSRDLGEVLPHWRVAVYLVNPAGLTQSTTALRVTLGSLIALLVLAIGAGGWLIVADLKRQLTLARQKTDFVSNVSHELKTPLTSIRMFSELLAEGRVPEAERQRHFLGIITAEAARLTRLINNVLDFARLERGETKYHFQPVDVAAIVRETCATYRPHLEASGFTLRCDVPEEPLAASGDRDALGQVLVNLLSNAEKYGGEQKQIDLAAERNGTSLCVKIMDRGAGVPRGCEEKIFEQFFRAHDSLSSGIQGSGLGLTLARQIARAHGGDVSYEPRAGGGSCFVLRLPAQPNV